MMCCLCLNSSFFAPSQTVHLHNYQEVMYMKVLILEYEDRDGRIHFCPSMEKRDVTITLPAGVSTIVIEKQDRGNATAYKIFGTDERCGG